MDTLGRTFVFFGIALALLGFGIPIFWRLLGRHLGKSSHWWLLAAFATALFFILNMGEEMGVVAELRFGLALLAVVIGGVNWARSRFS